MLFIKFIFFVFLMSKNVLSTDNFCKIFDITNINHELIQCKNNDLLFGYFEFSSQKSNHSLIKIKKYNIEIIKEYHNVVVNYLDNYCIKEKDIRIKNITNYDKIKKNFNTEVIITCNLKI